MGLLSPSRLSTPPLPVARSFERRVLRLSVARRNRSRLAEGPTPSSHRQSRLLDDNPLWTSKCLRICRPQVCSGLPVDAPPAFHALLQTEAWLSALPTLWMRLPSWGCSTSKINPRTFLLGQTPGLPGCRALLLHTACQVLHHGILGV